MHMRTTRLVGTAPLALSIVLALTACGGSGSSDEGQATEFLPGEVLTLTKTTQDGSTQEDHYLVHGVTADGDLLTDETAKHLTGALVALPLEAAGVPLDGSRLAQLRHFYKQLWKGIAERRNDGSDIAAEIGAYETDVEALYEDYRQSEFASVTDYVAFYEQVGENPYFDSQESVEEELVQFFYQTGWRQGAWLQALQRQQWDWPRFLQLMAQRGDTFGGLLNQYRAGGSSRMDDFVARYVNTPLIKKANFQVKSASGGSDSIFYVINPKWKFWDKNFERSDVIDQYGFSVSRYYASIISPKNKNPEAYDFGSRHGFLCKTLVGVHGRANITRAEVAYSIYIETTGNYVFDHESNSWIRGHWLRKIRIDGHAYTDYSLALGRNVVGEAEIKDLKGVTGNYGITKPIFNIETKMSVPKIFNTKAWKTTHTIDLDAPEICTTLKK
ncbi:hypothetical protein [Diaphorobacter sp.]|uniref:hypothetical protein n=1 Tax=Diaphorobacter sp. TaxID=1934310 RepID=UPI003D0D8854